SLLEKVSTLDAADAILAIEDVVRAAILGQNGVGAGHRLMLTTRLLATPAITDASQDRSADDLELHFATATKRRGALVRHFTSSPFHIACSACSGEVDAGSPIRTCAKPSIEKESVFRFHRNEIRSR